MTASEIARLIIRIEEIVNPDSEYYGKLVKWWEQEKELWHYGIGLSNTHFFNIGTIEAKELQILKRHDIIEQRDLDIRGNPGIYSPFESDEIIERLKYALRWLNDLPENSSKKKINGKSLAFLIFTDDEAGTDQDGELIPREIEFESYLKQNSPQLKQSKIRDFFEKGRTWLYIFLFGFGLMLAFIGLIPGVESGNFLIKWGSRLLFVLVSTLVLAIIFVLISNFKWSGFQKKSFWDWLQLLIVPLMLAFGAFYLNYASETRDKQIAKEGEQQELLKDYFSKMQTLIVETKKSKDSQSNPDRAPLLPEFQPIAQALTLAVLDELDGKRKGKIIIYLAKSGLINKDRPIIDLETANLQKLELNNNWTGSLIQITGADMTEAQINDINFANSNLARSNLSHATLKDVTFENSDLSGVNLDGATFKNVTFKKGIDNNYKDACYSLKTTVTSEPSQKDKLQSLHSLQNLGLKKISPGSDKCKLEPNKNKEINEDNKRM
ncbi:MAG: pentapeptide repeat-containing protein [Microcystis panniformis]